MRSSRSSRGRTSNGFTLTELLVIVSIIGALAAMAAPNLTRWQSQYTLKEAAIELMGDLNVARVTAMSRDRTIRVTVALTGGRIVATFLNDSDGTAALPPFTMQWQINGVAGSTLIRFNSRGMLVGAGTAHQNINLTSTGNQTYTVQVSPSGKVRWCPGAACT